MKEYIKPNIKSCEVSGESLLAGSFGDVSNRTPGHDDSNNQFSKKHGTTSLWDYDDGEEEEEENN